MHNVDTIDGLVLPTIAAMTASSKEEAGNIAAATAAVTRKSPQLEDASRAWGQLVYSSLREENDEDMAGHLKECAKQVGLRRTPSAQGADQMTYVSGCNALCRLLGMSTLTTTKYFLFP